MVITKLKTSVYDKIYIILYLKPSNLKSLTNE